jgi:NUDIX domain.
MKLFEKTLTSETKFEGRIIKVLRDTVELENGKTSAREVVCHNGGVCVAALTEQNEVLLVRQFRYPYKEVLLELPAGKLEKGEDPFEAVKREQMEETGTTGRKLHFARQSVPLSRLLRRDHPHLGVPCGPKRRNALRRG